MQIVETALPGVVYLRPTAFRDERGFFSRTYDADIAEAHGLPARFVQESQSRSGRHVLRGLHGRGGAGEAKLMRVARGSVHFVVLDARPESPAFGQHISGVLDDEELLHAYVPPRLLVGFQVLSDVADICYKMDRPHDGAAAVEVRHDDPELAIAWPHPPVDLSKRDLTSPSWAEFRATL